MKEFIKGKIKELTEKSVIDISTIPNIDLYMDQITTFIEERLSAYKKRDDDKIVTKTMINNYTKAGLIPPPVKKRYRKESIEELIIIFHFKYILSIENLRTLAKAVDMDEMDDMYKMFTDVQVKEGAEMSKVIENMKFSEDRKEVFKAVCALTEGAVLRKMLAERLIEKYFAKSEDDAAAAR